MSDDKMAGIRAAKKQQSLEKRRAVENAIDQLKENREPITFKSIAAIAKVSRQYLYNNFKDEISSYREKDRSISVEIDGVKVPTRTIEEYRHVEALLRNKVNRLKADLGSVRHENSRLKQALEKERGLTEHYRKNLISLRNK